MAHLGGFSEEALLLFQHAASEQGYDFSEGDDTYDFTRCVRPDGSFYGTGGSCKKGSPAGAKEKADSKPKVTATPGMAAKAKAAREKLKAERAANGGKRTDRIQEERRLERNRQERERERKLKANQKKQKEMLAKSGDSGKKV